MIKVKKLLLLAVCMIVAVWLPVGYYNNEYGIVATSVILLMTAILYYDRERNEKQC